MIKPAVSLIEESIRLHRQALGISGRLTQAWRDMYSPMAAEILPDDVIKILFEAGVRPVLMGTHGIGGWRKQARATQDVDVLVRKKDHKRAVKALNEAYPDLVIKDTPVVTRFLDPAINEVVIDVMKPSQGIFRLVFRHTIAVGETHDIPQLEMALVSKFAAMTSPNRDPAKKMIDGGDFMIIVRHNRTIIDLKKLRRLALKLYEEAGDEIMKMIEDIDAGRTLRV